MLYFAGDFHLGAPDRETSRIREERICRWLKEIAIPGNEIFLMGDIFDFWFEYKRTVPRGYVMLLATLREITGIGIPVTVFKGNHDMWMFGYLEEECGVKTISDGLEMERNGKKFFLHHGDGLGPGDTTYKFLRKIFRSSLAQWLFARIHPNTGMAIAAYFSRKSRVSQKGRFEKYLGDDTEFLTQYCKENCRDYNFMIFGHRHLVLDIKINENCRYINTGEWVTNSTYACFDGNNISLHRFE